MCVLVEDPFRRLSCFEHLAVIEIAPLVACAFHQRESFLLRQLLNANDWGSFSESSLSNCLSQEQESDDEPEAEKPSIDLFKAIFEASDSESESESDDDDDDDDADDDGDSSMKVEGENLFSNEHDSLRSLGIPISAKVDDSHVEALEFLDSATQSDAKESIPTPPVSSTFSGSQISSNENRKSRWGPKNSS